jgi:hypothetical protein
LRGEFRLNKTKGRPLAKGVVLTVLLAVAALLVTRRLSQHRADLKDEEVARQYSLVEPQPSSTPEYERYLLKLERMRAEDLDADRYQAKCLIEHSRQINDGSLEGIRTGSLCWYCKNPHAWKDCLDGKTFGEDKRSADRPGGPSQ